MSSCFTRIRSWGGARTHSTAARRHGHLTSPEPRAAYSHSRHERERPFAVHVPVHVCAGQFGSRTPRLNGRERRHGVLARVCASIIACKRDSQVLLLWCFRCIISRISCAREWNNVPWQRTGCAMLPGRATIALLRPKHHGHYRVTSGRSRPRLLAFTP